MSLVDKLPVEPAVVVVGVNVTTSVKCFVQTSRSEPLSIEQAIEYFVLFSIGHR